MASEFDSSFEKTERKLPGKQSDVPKSDSDFGRAQEQKDNPRDNCFRISIGNLIQVFDESTVDHREIADFYQYLFRGTHRVC